MRAAWVVIGVALVLVSGCAKQDWIDRTLVTVDVTGVWEGTQRLTTGLMVDIQLDLKQEAAKVTGWMTGVGTDGGTEPSRVPIVGTVSVIR